MMHAFDTLKASKVLLDAGFEQAQAESLAVTVRDAVTDNVATKDDLKIAKSELREEIGTVRVDMANLRSEMKEQFRDLYKHLWVMGLGIVGITVTLTVGLIAIFVMPN